MKIGDEYLCIRELVPIEDPFLGPYNREERKVAFSRLRIYRCDWEGTLTNDQGINHNVEGLDDPYFKFEDYFVHIPDEQSKAALLKLYHKHFYGDKEYNYSNSGGEEVSN